MERTAPLIVANWKMNGLAADIAEIGRIAEAAQAEPTVSVALCPPFTLIAAAALTSPGLSIGGQDCDPHEKGAHTGCISAQMIADAGGELVIVGHSERRADQDETSQLVRNKAEAALTTGLLTIVCVGESEAERDAGHAESVVADMLACSLPDGEVAGKRLVVAYEPVWAIGTGRTPTNDDIAAMHAMIRAQLLKRYGDDGATMPILYGGSMKGSNATEILALANVDGGLIGGASLKAVDFAPIINAAALHA